MWAFFHRLAPATVCPLGCVRVGVLVGAVQGQGTPPPAREWRVPSTCCEPPVDSYVIGGIPRVPHSRQSSASVDDFYLLPSTPATNEAEAVPVLAEWEEGAAPLELADRNTMSNSHYGKLPDVQSFDGDDECHTSSFADTNLFACLSDFKPPCKHVDLSASPSAAPCSYEVVPSGFFAISKAVCRPAPRAKAAKPSHTRRFLCGGMPKAAAEEQSAGGPHATLPPHPEALRYVKPPQPDTKSWLLWAYVCFEP